MNVTVEMVDGALDAWYDDGGLWKVLPNWSTEQNTLFVERRHKKMRAALEAALALTPDRAELMRAKVLELLAGKMKVLNHAATEGLGAEAARAILDDQQLLNAIMPQIAKLQVES